MNDEIRGMKFRASEAQRYWEGRRIRHMAELRKKAMPILISQRLGAARKMCNAYFDRVRADDRLWK